jgi:endoglucanase
MSFRSRGLGGRSVTSATTTPAPPPNNSPINSVPGAQSTALNTPKVFSVGNGNAIAVSDAENNLLTVRLTLNVGGVIQALGAGGVTISGNGTANVTITGLPAAVNTALNGLQVAPPTGFSGNALLTIQTSDGTLLDTDTVTVAVAAAPPPPAAQPPVNTIPGAQTATTAQAKSFGTATNNAITVADADSNALTTVLTATHGTISVVSGSGANVTNNGTATVTIAGTPAQINAALNGMSFTSAAGYSGAAQITVQTSDGTLTDTDVITITVTATAPPPAPPAAPPVNTIPGSQTVSSALPLVFNAANGRAITVADADSANVTTTLTATNGTVNAVAGGGATITGNGTALVTIAGTLAQVNAALNGVSYTSNAGYTGTATLTVATSDGALTDTDVININVAASAPAPTPAPAPLAVKLGTNLSGMEWANPSIRYGVGSQSNLHYTVPRLPDLKYLARCGMNTHRLPVQWELIQPVRVSSPANNAVVTGHGLTAKGQFWEPYARQIDWVLDQAAAAGVKIIIDLHNYCRYKDFIFNGDGSVTGFTVPNDPTILPYTSDNTKVHVTIFSLFNPTLPQSDFTDFWTRAANRWKNHPGLRGFSLMNEPNTMPSASSNTPFNDPYNGVPEDMTIWPTYAQAAINAIRAVTTTVPIYCGFNNWQAAATAGDTSVNPGFPLTGSNIIYDVHAYCDATSGGFRFNYDYEITNFTFGDPNGGVINVETLYRRIMLAVAWAQAHNVPLAVTESGLPLQASATTKSQDPRWNAEYARGMQACAANNVEFYGWMSGNHWPVRSFPLSECPQWYQNRTVEPLAWGFLKAGGAAFNYSLVNIFDSAEASYVLSGNQVLVTVQARGYTSTPINLTVASDNGGSFSKTALTLAAGANSSDSFSFTPAADRVTTLSYTRTGGGQVPPPRKVYSVIDPVSLAATNLTNGARAILAKYKAAIWLASDAYTDFLETDAVPSPNGGKVRAISDSGFGSTLDNPLEMIQFANEDVPSHDWQAAPVAATDPNGVRYVNFEATGVTRGLWCRKRKPGLDQSEYDPFPLNRNPADLNTPLFIVTGIRVTNQFAGGRIAEVNDSQGSTRVSLNLNGAKPMMEFMNDSFTTIGNATSANAMSLNLPHVVSLKSKSGAQSMRLDRTTVATTAFALPANTCDSVQLGGGMESYYPASNMSGGMYLAILGIGDIAANELDIVEQYAQAICNTASAPAPSPAPAPTPTPAPAPTPTPAPSPTPAPAPSTGDAVIQSKVTAGILTSWLRFDWFTNFWQTWNDPASQGTDWNVHAGRWKDYSGQGHDYIEDDSEGPFQEGPIETDTNGKQYVHTYSNAYIEGIGGATTGFYCCFATDSGNYGPAMYLSDKNGNSGLEINYDGNAGAYIVNVGNGSAITQVQSAVLSSGQFTPPGKHVWEVWVDTSAHTINVRADKGTVASAAFTGTIGAGTANMATGSLDNIYEGVIFKNHVPSAQERDLIATYIGSKMGVTI